MTEILGARMLAPRFGGGLYPWTALISVTLLGIAAGSSFGGRLADRFDGTAKPYASLIGLAAITLLASIFLAAPVLSFSSELGAALDSLTAATLLFLLPIGLLGASFPYAIRASSGGRPLGRSVGSLYSASTLGSLVGALASGLYLIPQLGVRQSLYCAIGLLAVVVAIFTIKRPRHAYYSAACIGALLFAGSVNAGERESTGSNQDEWCVVDHLSSPYADIMVAQQGLRGDRVMLIDGTCQTLMRAGAANAMGLSYARYLSSLLLEQTSSSDRIAVVGLGGGLLSSELARNGRQVQAIELDPAVVRMATRWFHLDTRSVNVHVGDGRTWISNQDRGALDVLVFDVANGGSQPGHTLSAEAIEEARDALSPNGVLFLNLISESESTSHLIDSVRNTIAHSFPSVAAYNVSPIERDGLTNVIFIATNSLRDQMRIATSALDLGGASVPQRDAEAPLLTDNWNPLGLWSIEIEGRWRKLTASRLGLPDSIFNPQ